MSLSWNILQYSHPYSKSLHNFTNSNDNIINYPLPLPPFINNVYTHAIIVTGHAIYNGPLENVTQLYDESNWILEPYQHNQVPTFIEHIIKGIQLLKSNPQSILLFSGGQTRSNAGPISEGSSYWKIAQLLLKSSTSKFSNNMVLDLELENTNEQSQELIQQLSKRMIVEEYALDSFENVLYSICRFSEMTNVYPNHISIIGFEFKRARFELLHLPSIRFKSFKYIGIDPNSISPEQMISAQHGELLNSYQPFEKDLYGCHSSLKQKKLDRNPFRRRSPYRTTCPTLQPLLDYCPSKNNVFDGPLPWV
ncbi:unnamed protein product [Cunninghamella echinulata]